MRKLRVPVLIAWFFCALVSAASILSAASTLAQIPGAADKLDPVGGAFWDFLPMLFAIPAALIISHQPRNVIGWLLMTLPLIALPVEALDRSLAALPAAPQPSIPLLLMMTISGISWVALIFPILLIPLFFPTGRLLSHRWRWVVYLAAAMTVTLFFFGFFSEVYVLENIPWTLTNPYGFVPQGWEQYFGLPWVLLLLVLTITGLASIFVRYRRAAAVEREQMKWLLYACIMFGLVFIPSILFDTGRDSLNQNFLFDLLFVLSISSIPAAITAAILRYRLFDIDVIIRLTLVYATVTALLGLVYAGGVALMQVTLGALTGQTSELAVLVTTLAIAALFNPLRLRVQEMINRRFYRQKYNADQAIAEFATAARSGSDLEALTGMLTDLVAKTLEPAQVSLYMKEKGKEEKDSFYNDSRFPN